MDCLQSRAAPVRSFILKQWGAENRHIDQFT